MKMRLEFFELLNQISRKLLKLTHVVEGKLTEERMPIDWIGRV